MMMTKEDVCLGPWRLCKCVSRAWSKDFKMLSWMRTHAPGVKDCSSKRRVVKTCWHAMRMVMRMKL